MNAPDNIRVGDVLELTQNWMVFELHVTKVRKASFDFLREYSRPILYDDVYEATVGID